MGKKCQIINKSPHLLFETSEYVACRIDMIIGAILTWATGPWDRLFFCPAPKIHSTKYIFLAKNPKSPKWDRLILARNGALEDKAIITYELMK